MAAPKPVVRDRGAEGVDPAPDLEGKEIPDMAGTRASGAVNRYDTGTVIEPESIETTSNF